MNLRLLLEAFPHGQSAGCAIVDPARQAETVGSLSLAMLVLENVSPGQ
jgi:hypothetical protein